MEIIFFGIALLLTAILSFHLGGVIMKGNIEKQLLEVLSEHTKKLEEKGGRNDEA